MSASASDVSKLIAEKDWDTYVEDLPVLDPQVGPPPSCQFSSTCRHDSTTGEKPVSRRPATGKTASEPLPPHRADERRLEGIRPQDARQGSHSPVQRGTAPAAVDSHGVAPADIRLAAGFRRQAREEVGDRIALPWLREGGVASSTEDLFGEVAAGRECGEGVRDEDIVWRPENGVGCVDGLQGEEEEQSR